MLTIDEIDAGDRGDVRRFVAVPHRLYRGDPNWVPPLTHDVAVALDRRRHPFYEHSEAAFFVAVRNGQTVGRIGALELRPYNHAHDERQVSFTMFDCTDDLDAAAALFTRVFEWGHKRRLTRAVGPRGLSALDGYGVLVDGFERRQLMTMTAYNGQWYPRLLEAMGFTEEVDFVSYQLTSATFTMPDAIRRVAARASGRLRVVRYDSKRALIRAARHIGAAYNQAFVDNWEYYPLSDREISFLIDQVRPIVNYRLMTFIASGEKIVGFVLAFPDVSRALQRARGRLTPWSIARLLLDRYQTTSVALNGAGIDPSYQGRGGNALLYTQIERALREGGFERAELPQVAKTATRMRADLERLGATPIKTHRVYQRVV